MTGKSIDRGNGTCRGLGAGSVRWTQEPERTRRRKHEDGARGEVSRDLAAQHVPSAPGSAFTEPWSSRGAPAAARGPFLPETTPTSAVLMFG